MRLVSSIDAGALKYDQTIQKTEVQKSSAREHPTQQEIQTDQSNT
ncbi:hypothetical protein [Polaromonas sp. CG_9.11]|nr:hypothetical protein [Polaromonas sp. CG_9.11]